MLRLTNHAGEPIGNEAGDLGAVLFQHQHMAVAVNATLFEPDEIDLNPAVAQILHSAMIVGRVIRRLAGHQHDRDVRQIRETACRRLLPPAAHNIWEVGLRL